MGTAPGKQSVKQTLLLTHRIHRTICSRPHRRHRPRRSLTDRISGVVARDSLRGLHIGAIAILLSLIDLSAAHAQQAVDEIVSAVVRVRAEVPGSARTAASLGTSRVGSGVVIDGRGLVLTIGYLVLEANRVYVSPDGSDGPEVSAEVLAYDHETGFGLLRTREPLANVTPMPLGESNSLQRNQLVMIASYGGSGTVRPAVVTDRREFAGYWEYLLDSAVFVTPPHPRYGGAALIDTRGRLVGIGSVVVDDADGSNEPVVGNMFVPIDLLKPIMGELLADGRRSGPYRPWVGVYVDESQGSLVVHRVAAGGPAQRAGIEPGDIITAVAGQSVGSMADMYRTLWAKGRPGGAVSFSLHRLDGRDADVDVGAIDRYDWLKLDPQQ